MNAARVLLGLYGFGVLVSTAIAVEHRAASAADIVRITPQLRPGDVLVMADGAWADQVIVFRGTGTEDKPITLAAESPGKVVLTGNSSLAIDGEHLIVRGVFLKDAQSSGDGIRMAGRHCRLTETAVVAGTAKFFIHLFGEDHRVDHCHFSGKTNDSPTMQVEVEGRLNRHRIDHNHFGPRPPLGRNGGETIRVGYSHQSMTNSSTLVERNLFERCDGEIEIISNKSCGNVYRLNTFLDCAGMLTLRHGNRCIVEGNFFLGRHKRGSGGIRVIGEDHVVINNYIDGVMQGGFWITSGIADSPLNGYFQARNCVIAFNTVVDSRGPCVELDAGFGTSRRTLRPENITLARNLFVPAAGGTILKGEEGAGFKWIGNVAWPGTNAAGSAPFSHPGIRLADPKLERGKDGLARLPADSPLRGAEELGFHDIKGAPDAAPNRPLTAADTGPSWMK